MVIWRDHLEMICPIQSRVGMGVYTYFQIGHVAESILIIFVYVWRQVRMIQKLQTSSSQGGKHLYHKVNIHHHLHN